MVSESPHSSRNGTPVSELEALHLISRPNTPSKSSASVNNMTAAQNTSSPSGTPPPTSSTGLKFSFAKGAAPIKSAAKPSSKLSNGITAFHAHDDSDDDDESRKTSKVTHLENGAVVSEIQTIKEEKKPLVIKPPETQNEHWLQRRLKLFRPDMIENKPREGVDLSNIPDRIGDTTGKVGLQLTKKSSPSPPSAQDTVDTPEQSEMQVDTAPPKTDDDLARELLIAQASDPHALISTQPKLVIPARKEPLNEADVYAYDMAHLADAPTLETYERVPVEAFGMGILLGLGWKEGTDLKGNKAEGFKEPKKRPDFLGIGAKEEEFLKVDAKGQKLSRKDALGGSWNPLKKIDKRTGEVIVEDEKGSRRSTPKDNDRSGVSTPRKDGSRYSTPSGGYDSSRDRERDRERRREDDRDRDRDRRRDDDRDRRKDKYRDDGRSSRDDRRYDSDRESSKRRDREFDSDRKRRDKDYDSDYDRKRRKEGDRSTNSSRRESRRPSPESKHSRSPRKDR